MQSGKNTAILNNSYIGHTSAGLFLCDDVMTAPAHAFFNEAVCREWILKRLHPDGAYCPGCGLAVPERALPRFWEAERVKCSACGKFFTALTGTFLSGCQLDFCRVIRLADLLALGVPDKKIAEILPMSAANVRIWRNKYKAIEKLRNG